MALSILSLQLMCSWNYKFRRVAKEYVTKYLESHPFERNENTV